MARSLVLDRSYLQAALAPEVQRLCDGYRVIMPEALFFEILTAGTGLTRALFDRFPARENPVAIVPHVGVLMKREIETREPASPAEKLALQERFIFNTKLRTGEFSLTPQQQAGVDEWEAFQRDSQFSFVERYARVHAWFPELASYKGGQATQPIATAMHRVARDASFVASIYDRIRGDDFPQTVEISPAWALYRWTQVQLLYTLEYIKRYGAGRQNLVSKELANDMVDAQYVTTAVLADALASGDSTVKTMYQSLKPEGELLWNQ